MRNVPVGPYSRRNEYEKIEDVQTFQELNIDSEDRLLCFAYQYSTCRLWMFHICAVLLLGIPYLWVYWHEECEAYLKCRRSYLRNADVLLLKDSNGKLSIEHVRTNQKYPRPSSLSSSEVRYFHHQLVKYVWDGEQGQFHHLSGLDDGNLKLSDIVDNSPGFTEDEQADLLQLFGPNLIDVEVKSYWQLFAAEVFHPFYIFQIGSVILWSFDEYYSYAACVFVLSIFSVAVALIETRRQSLTMRGMVSASNNNSVLVCRKGKVEPELVPSLNLVPGDLIAIPPHGCLMACDAVLLAGNCIVNESMLTGESIPVTKTPPSHTEEIFHPDNHKRHTLFCGTEVIQTRFYGNDKVVAVVARTGFSTAKGELVRSILCPKPMGLKFYEDSVKFVFMLFSIAACGMVYCIYLYVKMGATIGTILLRTLDIVTIVVPPALPAAMTVGIVYSQSRLREKGIFCISPPRINVCGKLKLVCFDKTGTLTEDGLDLWGIIPNHNQHFDHPEPDPTMLTPNSPLMVAMAVCHSLTLIEGKLTGDPLDLKMFEAVKWILEEPGKDTARFDLLLPTIIRPGPELLVKHPDWKVESKIGLEGEELPYEVGIIRQFAFSSNAQCMSVIARTLGDDHMTLYCKGAPEKIQSLCISESIPDNYSEVLMQYASSGYRVLAVGVRELEPTFSWRQSQRVKREKVERDLTFLGFLVMRNNLKPETAPVIQQLHRAQLRLIMVTGDNLLTAVSVSRECGLIHASTQVIMVHGYPSEGERPARIEFEPAPIQSRQPGQESICVPITLEMDNVCLALDGHAWAIIRKHFPALMQFVTAKGSVFARMAPDQKSQLVEALQEINYIVAMCGDGANDCGALKAAHIGVSLSEAEASVAAPFTSKVANISCVVSLVKEGRCALVTSFGVFKYMALYSLTQFVSVLILYTCGINLGDMQFLYIDLVITTSLAVVMGRSGPSERLGTERPVGSLASFGNVLPLLLQVALTAGTQLLAFFYLQYQPWHKAVHPTPGEEVITCWENTVIFCVSCFQYLILATVYSKGEPHRKPFYTNSLFMLTLLILIGFSSLLLLYPVEPLGKFFQLMPFTGDFIEVSFRLTLLLLPIGNLLFAFLIENAIADTRWLKKFIHFITRKRQPKNKYKIIEKQLFEGSNLPNFNQTLYAE